jgi:hypothetical protein
VARRIERGCDVPADKPGGAGHEEPHVDSEPIGRPTITGSNYPADGPLIQTAPAQQAGVTPPSRIDPGIRLFSGRGKSSRAATSAPAYDPLPTCILAAPQRLG